MKLLIVCGATASGKTNLALDLAERLNGEIVSADSQLVYKGLNIGTAKPTKEEMRGIVHHLIDVVEPTEKFSVSDYQSLARFAIDDIISRGKTPIVCGGTGFYINSILYDLSYGKAAADESIRKQYEELALLHGNEYVFDILKEIDYETSQKLHANDLKRVIRAIEIYMISGKRKSEYVDTVVPKYEYDAFAINLDRKELYQRIDARVELMFANGLIEEVEWLLDRGIDENYQSMQAIGYKEIVNGLKNGDLRSTMLDIIKLNTRHYAKRQVTFFKKMPSLIWLDKEKATAKAIVEYFR